MVHHRDVSTLFLTFYVKRLGPPYIGPFFLLTKPPMPRSSETKSDLALLFTVLVWGFNFPILKAALAVMPPHAMNVFRLSVSALALGGLYVAQQRKAGASFFAPFRTHGWPIFGMGLLGFLLYQYCFIVGIDKTTAGSAALIMASSPLWTAVFGHVFRFDFLRPAAWLGLLTTLMGAVIIVLGSAEEIDFSNAAFLGNVIIVAAAVFWGAYTAFNKPLSRHVTPVSISFLGLLVALPFLYALGLPYFDDVVWDGITVWIWLAIIFSGGLSTGIAVALWNTAVKQVGPSNTAAYGNLVPLIALFSSAVFLGERIALAQLAGGAFILGGLVIMRRHRLPRTS